MSNAGERIETAARLQRLLKFLEQDPTNLTLRKDVIRAALDAHRWAPARELVNAGLRTHPREPELLALSGSILLHMERYPEAVHVLSDALLGGIESGEVQYNLAFALYMVTRYSEAIRLLTDTVVAQVLPMALLLRARCLHHAERPLEAIADCNAYLQLVAGDADANGLLGLLLYDQSRADEASVRAEIALTRNAFQPEALLTRASLLADNDQYRAAEMCFEALLQAHPLCGRGWFGFAMLELRQMHVEEAHRYLRLAAVRMPLHVGCWHGLAWIEILRGDLIAARMAFERAMVLDRTFAETYGGLAVVAAMQGREQEARDSVRRALRLNASSVSARYAELLLLELSGKHKEARAVFETLRRQPAADRGAERGIRYMELVRLHIAQAQMHAAETQAATLH